MKIFGFEFEPVAWFAVARGRRAQARTFAAFDDGEIEEQRQVRLESTGRKSDYFVNERRLEAAPRALLSKSYLIYFTST
jgi:hypothetical protein